MGHGEITETIGTTETIETTGTIETTETKKLFVPVNKLIINNQCQRCNNADTKQDKSKP
jgi:hypothetical protein